MHEQALQINAYLRCHNDIIVVPASSRGSTISVAEEASAAARKDADIKAELGLRLEETAHRMWDAVDARETAAAARLAELAGDGWVEAVQVGCHNVKLVTPTDYNI
jgi:hypothetical protein